MFFELTPRRHELVCAYMLGAATLFMYIGYTIQAFISESVIHIISQKEPERISQYAGYYGQAFHYAAFAISSIITPTLLNFIPSKWILSAASILFAVYYLGFIHVTSLFFYLTQILMGVGYSLYNNGEGAYLSEHSSRRTISSNTGIETAVSHSSMLVGGCVLALIYKYSSNGDAAVTGFDFTETQIRVVYLSLFALNIVSVVLFTFLPTKQYDSIASKASNVVPSFKTQIKQLGQTVFKPNMLILAPFFLYMGLIVSYLMVIFPTTLPFTKALGQDIYIVPIYSMAMGTAEIIGGLFIRPMIKKMKQWGLVLVMAMHTLGCIGTIVMSAMSVPNSATLGPTVEDTLFITPCRLSVFAVGLLIGIGDFSITTGRAVICQLAVPENRMEVFSLSRLWQCVSSVIVLAFSSKMTLTHWLVTLSVGLVAGSISFIIVAIRTRQTNTVTPSEESVVPETKEQCV